MSATFHSTMPQLAKKTTKSTICLVAVAITAVTHQEAVAKTGPALRHLSFAQTPAASDGSRYAVWLDRSGRAVILDTTTNRRKTTQRLCSPAPAAGHALTPVAGDGLAIIACAPGATTYQRLNLRTAASSPLNVPISLKRITAAGRYWLKGNGDTTDPRTGAHAAVDFFINRATGRLVSERTVADGSSTTLPARDPDTRSLAAITISTEATRMLLSGAPLDGIPSNSLVIRDPRRTTNTTVRTDCEQRCGVPFGRVGRLTYVRYALQKPVIEFVQSRKPTLSWTFGPAYSQVGGSSADDVNLETFTVQPVLTTNHLLASLYVGSRGWDIRAADLSRSQPQPQGRRLAGVR
ncbi:hypothetical protein DSM112329_02867 [Paraconexibacter sp. AEG42_29]|uniref:Uncharacterized protein n=1 Tax=Paraconexibacter sp. AEG42_29 TaxID=2997339 RepID=A0AAU7AWM5_9ACTN